MLHASTGLQMRLGVLRDGRRFRLEAREAARFTGVSA
jgi:hypothetical protein